MRHLPAVLLLLSLSAIASDQSRLPASAAGRDDCPAFAIEDIFSAPFPTNLVAAPAEGKVAWVFNHRGVRNAWVAQPPDYRGAPVTAYFEDDGQDIYGLQRVPDARSLVYVRGGDEEMGRENPNLRSKPKTPTQEVWIVSPDKSQPRSLGEGHSPRVSPDGKWIAFAWGAGDRIVFPWERDGWIHLYSVPLAGGAATLLTPGAFEVEFVSLSPHRDQVVFSSNQNDINRRHLWTVSVSGGTPTSVTSGSGIEWKPAPTSDGKATAFLGSDARRCARPLLKIGDQVRELAPGSAAVPEAARDSQLLGCVQSAGTAGVRPAPVGVIAGGFRQELAIARAGDPRRRRPQRHPSARACTWWRICGSRTSMWSSSSFRTRSMIS
jgi:hypothetical protein